MAVRTALSTSIGSLCVLFASRALAGGFEQPDHGAQALGRGGAFTAKADDPTAVHYNVAGLARQRGTKLFVSGSLIFNSYEFQRSGVYPDNSNDPATPWGGQPFPLVKNTAGPALSPYFAVTSDLGFDRFTGALAVYGPSTAGNRTFPLGIENKPSPARYDFIQSRSLLMFPTAAAAYRLTSWLDVGLAGHLVIGRFDQTTISYADAVPGMCKNAEYQPCDARNVLDAAGMTGTVSIGAMVHPSKAVDIGLHVRGPASIHAEGKVSATPPIAANVPISPGGATLDLDLPTVVRAGVRYAGLEGATERYDIELDATYELWGIAQSSGPRVRIPALGSYRDIDTTVLHQYDNTLSLRLGGAYNFGSIASGQLSLRAGGFYESAATTPAMTRLDFDTLAKLAGTLGVGYRWSGFGIDAAYAAIDSLERTVEPGTGALRPINGAKQGRTVDSAGQLLPAVNEGRHSGFNHVISLGVVVFLDEAIGKPRRDVNAFEETAPEPKPEPSAPPADARRSRRIPFAL